MRFSTPNKTSESSFNPPKGFSFDNDDDVEEEEDGGDSTAASPKPRPFISSLCRVSPLPHPAKRMKKRSRSELDTPIGILLAP